MFNTLWAAPLQIILGLVLLWQQLGAATITGMVIMILLVPFNAFITTKMRFVQMMIMKEKDKRVKLMNEILNGIKVLKLYAWETSFRDIVQAFRGKKCEQLNRMAYLNATMVFTFSSAPFFVRYNHLLNCVIRMCSFGQIGLLSFATYVLISPENVLDANKAFVSLSLFNIIRMF